METKTNGNVIVEKINVGDFHYEHRNGMCVKSVVVSKPVQDRDGFWVWESKNVFSGDILKYNANSTYPQYNPVIYNHENGISEFIIN